MLDLTDIQSTYFLLTSVLEIGLALMTMGIGFFGLGMMLLFDAGLLALGNVGPRI